jgi:hypothetical protein
MTSFSWTAPVDGAWNDGALWTSTTPGTAPNDIAADVTIDAGSTLYTVILAANTTETVRTLTMNDVNGRPGSNDPTGYHAALLELDGTLAYAPGSLGGLDGSLQTTVHNSFGSNAEILNAGTLNAFIQVEGNLLLTGTNGVYITNELQALSFASVTIDAPIAEMAGTTLFDGIFQAKGQNAVVNLGGAAVAGVTPGSIVNIATIQGPSTAHGGDPASWTELTFADPLSQINEWNGTAYVSVESSITTIDSGGTIDLTFGKVFTSANTLTVDHLGSSIGSGLLNLESGTVTTAGLNINGGIVQGFGTINGPVANNGTLIALGGTLSLAQTTAGTLDVTGALTGTGTVLFDLNNQGPGHPDPTEATLVLHSVSAGQTVIMNGSDTLVLAAPSAFSGTIEAGEGDSIVLQGLTATRAVLANGTLLVSNGAQQVAALNLSGNLAGESFIANGSTVTIASATQGEVVLQGSSSQYLIADNNGSLFVEDTVAGRDGVQSLPGDNLMQFADGTGVFDPTGTAEDVARLYLTALNRAPDVGGLEAWTGAIDIGHQPLSFVAAQFTASTEFNQLYGGLSDDGFVRQLYLNALGRPADPGGEQAWDGLLASGAGRGVVVQAFAESQEAKAHMLGTAGDADNGEVFRLYQTAFNRVPDAGGANTWAAVLASGATPEQVAQDFVVSQEFQNIYGGLDNNGFVSALYTNALHRAADPAGLAAWTGALNAGMSKADVVLAFSDSVESRLGTAGATHANWVFIPAA